MHLSFANAAARGIRILFHGPLAQPAKTRTTLPSTETLHTGHLSHFNEHCTQHNMCPHEAKIVRTGLSKQMAQVLAMCNSS